MPGTHAFVDLELHPECETYPGLRILRFDGGLFFVNAHALADRLHEIRVRSTSALEGVIITMEGVNFIDTEGADTVKAIVQAGIDMNINVHLARVKPQVMEVLERDGAVDLIGREHIHDSVTAAAEFQAQLHPMA